MPHAAAWITWVPRHWCLWKWNRSIKANWSTTVPLRLFQFRTWQTCSHILWKSYEQNRSVACKSLKDTRKCTMLWRGLIFKTVAKGRLSWDCRSFPYWLAFQKSVEYITEGKTGLTWYDWILQSCCPPLLGHLPSSSSSLHTGMLRCPVSSWLKEPCLDSRLSQSTSYL